VRPSLLLADVVGSLCFDVLASESEVLAAFAAHKDEVTAGYVAAAKPR
jgi:hypothetical protein